MKQRNIKQAAILIDAAAQAIRAVEYEGLQDMRRLLGGSIDMAYSWANGDTLYVDGEGLLKPQKGFFMLEPVRHPLPGNGLLVGKEVEDPATGEWWTAAPTITIKELRALVSFRTREQIEAWGKAQASEPAVAFTDAQGTPVIERWGSFIARMPKA
ncbi:MAG: hypothetical protein JOY71_18790 [Acetobacteraceae bacterium]|nr:hypothetical protein [Acetobacteraceae bacterium]MBV8589285.1 hypothetical protein [Acetobacteraceae bacterium]